MNRVASVTVLAAMLLVACKSDKPQPTPAPSDSSAPTMRAIDDGDVAVPPDYEKEALEAITPENVEAEVAKMEKDLE